MDMGFTIHTHQAMSGRWTSIIYLGKVPLYKSSGNVNLGQSEENAWYEFGYHLRRLITTSIDEVAAEFAEDGE